MNGPYFKMIDTPVGAVTVCADDNAVNGLYFGDRTGGKPQSDNRVIEETERQLKEYFEGKRKDFDIPVTPHGTPFQMKVWAALRDIPYGETRSYGQIAAAAGNPKASRAVGMANNRNPISIIVPCHRVIGCDGRMVGYGGGLDKKEYLLALEQGR